MNGHKEAGARDNECAFCGEAKARLTVERTSFEYGERGASVTLHADMPVWECQECGERYTGEGAEEAERAAVCAHLGRLTPAEIVELRKSTGLTQEAFSKELGVGRVSLARWETGQQMQSAVYDRLIRDLAQRFEARKNRPRQPVFRTNVNPRRAAAEQFCLVA